MQQGPSRTALAAAAHRAAHQLFDSGAIFADPLAVRIVGADPAEIARGAEARPEGRGMRWFIAARSKFAEGKLAEAVRERGVTQLVVLGAGLDTFAYRNPFEGPLRVFEVDHPATQAWKRQRLTEAGIAIPTSLVFAPVNFETDTLTDGLARAGFDPAQRTFFTWLGVVPYLTPQAIQSTLAAIAGVAGGGEVVFDYSDPPATLSPEMAAHREARAKRVAAMGEPFISSFEPADLYVMLNGLGFGEIDDLNPRDIVSRLMGMPAGDNAPTRGGHVIFTATP
jgi:methyltransferase (TIGR00027 family)